ncbi:2-hydroxy-3-keto-5-methylthiopentenyl-1-phosphate phosphatase-like protein [Eremomyces bilateralis CBS 781.70]|uniref:2-hydroxy-3-keto-5-methylthiopentenyl-1- phosphate phosphatase-like protein n=1 Tax=Eremomyces bilateralis CBS 781.70 TaxID=1392243 RepID=A0A6G1FXM2_9PEZI|nr:2-hydroxy-3-keto-5-methylthiopentenyl-1-phosphate phosphatase-like protein [Eremomyces bilateralis CBS 781.70]KAF1810431.1 2-hydroxy-3-keto-5-methylthiopentenyl-1-phosphate phosphatase-like protein [Eremomyces bilateralis CBS 781.70]
MSVNGAAPLPAMATNPKFIFFTDFDGTVTLSDSNDYITDNLGFGHSKRRQLNFDVLEDKMPFRDSFKQMMDSITTSFPECMETLRKNIKLDPHFKDFLDWSISANVPIVVLSGGMEPVIRALFEELVGKDAERIQIVSNDVAARPGKSIDQVGGWEIQFLHPESGFGHDKSVEIRKYSTLPERPVLFYAGDGVSDLSAARETDLLFAKKGHDLVNYCVREDVPFTIFQDWSAILEGCKEIAEGRITVKEAAQRGFEQYKKDKAGA